MKKEILNQNATIHCISDNVNGHSFFGYYDVCPWDERGRYVLVHEVDFINRDCNERDVARVGMVDTQNNNAFIPIGQTNAWNFQQGARLQWLPRDRKKVIYNIRRGNAFGSVIYDILTKTKKELAFPIYSLSSKDDIALSVNYSRLGRLGGYGYKGVEDVGKDDPVPNNDGIFLVDLRSGERTLVVSVADVAGFKSNIESQSHHALMFPLFNPSGDRFCFLHRFKLKDGGIYTRLLTAAFDGTDISLLAEGTLSHFTWLDDEHILIWGRSRSYLTKVRRYKLFSSFVFVPLLAILRRCVRGFVRHTVIGDRYLLCRDKSGVVGVVGKGVLDEDGHPSRFKKSHWLVTDTYPDQDHYRPLILYNTEKNQRVDVCKLYSLPDKRYLKDCARNSAWDLSAMRSDLHPRWNRGGDAICVDSVHNGKREVFVVDVKEIVG